jgi:N-acetylglucosaminyldiphosphoundecaprenol N-acetyl-beta-D-mannosaminyltransferase
LYPNVQIVGSHNGFFEMKDTSIPDDINACDPDLVLVALGCPRQENWISMYIDHFQKGVFIGVGGSFDSLAGNVQRAPEMWQKMNLEWFYRLLKQPSRWRRMLALPHFVMKVVGQKVKGTPSK